MRSAGSLDLPANSSLAGAAADGLNSKKHRGFCLASVFQSSSTISKLKLSTGSQRRKLSRRPLRSNKVAMRQVGFGRWPVPEVQGGSPEVHTQLPQGPRHRRTLCSPPRPPLPLRCLPSDLPPSHSLATPRADLVKASSHQNTYVCPVSHRRNGEHVRWP